MKKSNPNQFNLFDGEYTLKGVECRLALRANQCLYSNEPVDSTRTAGNLLREELAGFANEYFVVLNLDARKRPINYFMTGPGATSSVNVDIQSVFKTAILCNASAVILMHNHPNGDALPSEEDKLVTKRIREVGDILGYQVLDHIIVNSEGEYFSFCDAGLI